MNNRNILITHAYFLNEDEKEKRIMKPYVPLGILYLSAFLETKNIQHEVFDSTFSSSAQLKSHLIEKKPGLVAIYTNLMTKLNVLNLITYIKEHSDLKHTRIVLGGPEIRYNAENYLKNGADLLVIGEGEETFYELCDYFLREGNLPTQINGTAFIANNQIVFTNERSLIKDINILPMPARKNIDLKLYGEAWKKHHGYSMYSMSTMRGCPYTCKWCSRAVYGGTYRRRSPKLVVAEMKYLKENYNPDRIWFVDDVFTISHKWLKEFHDELKKEMLNIPFEIITRADRMNLEVIELLKQTGCFRVWIGAESGSQKIIDAMDRRVDVKTVGEMIVKTKLAGIEAGTFIMLGYPGETKSDIKETINHLKHSDPSFYTITVAYPITGTPFFEDIKHELVTADNWNLQTDRENDFKRTHSKKYYEEAVNWIYNEVNYSKSKQLTLRCKYKAKSIIAQAKMFLS